MGKGFAIATLLGAALSSSPARATEPVRPDRVHPDLGPVRYRDPASRREVWLGLDVGGVAVPRRLGLYEDRIWTARVAPTWAVALVPGLAIGGRHSMTLYDVTGGDGSIRLRQHAHQLEVSASPLHALRGTRARDRLFIGVHTHVIPYMRVDDVEVRVGGVRDTVLDVGYGLSHPFASRWRFDWRIAARHAWVFLDQQTQLHASARLVVHPRPGHVLWAEAGLYAVGRDEGGAQRSVYGRRTAHGVFAGQYAWMSRFGVGPFVRGDVATHFAAGRMPVFETRTAALDSAYADVTVGLRVAW